MSLITWTPDGAQYLIGWSEIVIFDSATGEEETRLPGNAHRANRENVFTPDGSRLISWHGGIPIIKVWNFTAHTLLEALPPHYTESLEFSTGETCCEQVKFELRTQNFELAGSEARLAGNTIRSLMTAPIRLNNLNRALGWMLSGYLVVAVPVQTSASDRDLHFALVGQAPIPGFNKLGSIRIHGNYAFCTFVDPDSGSGGFIGIDVEDPANPKSGELTESIVSNSQCFYRAVEDDATPANEP